MPVRDATPADAPEIAAMVVELAAFEGAADQVETDADGLAAQLFGPEPAARVLIAEPPGRPSVIAGMALWFPTFSTWVGRPGIWLEDLFVRPDHRRCGLAGELLQTLASRTEGRVEWQVLEWNAPAIAVYERLGATRESGWFRYRWLPSRGQEG